MLDSLDGRVARLLRVDSQMGKELDSLADVVTFGAKTSCFNVLHIFLKLRNHRIIHSGIIPSFRAYRLARFNVTPSSTSMKYFTGVPITATGGLVAFLTLFSHTIPKIVLITVFVTFAFLMVSRIRIPSLKDVPIPRYSIIITLFLVGIIITMYQTGFGNFSVFLFIAIPLYILYMLSQFIRQRPSKKRIKK